MFKRYLSRSIQDGPKKWHTFGIWVFYPIRCTIVAILIYLRIIVIKWRHYYVVFRAKNCNFFKMIGLAHNERCLIYYLKRENVSFIEPQMWPPNSPDLNPVDYAVWGTLRQQVYHNRKFTTVDQLKQVIVEEWNKLPQSFIGSLYLSLTPKINTCNTKPA